MSVLVGGSLLGFGGAGNPAGAQEPVTPPDTLHVEDVRILHWPEDGSVARRFADQVQRMAPLPALPPDLPTRVDVVLAPDEDRFQALAGGGPRPTWEAGLARPEEGLILMPTEASNRTRSGDQAITFRHEWAHVGLGEYLKPRRVPRWFHEGYASWASGSWDASAGWQLRLALMGRRASALDSLDLRWPADPAGSQVAYLLSATAVEYLTRASGERGLRLFLTRWRELGSLEAAMRRTYGVTVSQFEEDWRRYVKRRYGWLLTLSNAVVLWIFLGSLALWAYWVRRRRAREKMAQLRAGEPPENPAWWMPPNPGPKAGYQSPSHPPSVQTDSDRTP